MQRIQGDAAQRARVRFGQVFLAAPDIDADVFRDLAQVYLDLAERTTLYASPRDRAVAMAQWLYDAPRAGFTPPVTIVDGIDTIEVPAMREFSLLDLGHSYFAEAAGVLHDMFDLLRRNATPRERQRLDQQSTPDGQVYWRVFA
jgi:esterase/lipase superfamily enzyme